MFSTAALLLSQPPAGPVSSCSMAHTPQWPGDRAVALAAGGRATAQAKMKGLWKLLGDTREDLPPLLPGVSMATGGRL